MVIRQPIAGRRSVSHRGRGGRRASGVALIGAVLACVVMPAPAAPPAASSSLVAAAQAAQAGIRSCLPAIERVESYLKGQQAEDGVAFWSRKDPDGALFSALLTLEHPQDDTPTLASLNAARSADGGCVVEYTQTGYTSLACHDFARRRGFADAFVRDLGKKTALFQARGSQVTIYLTRAGQGCLWVRKEVIVEQPPQAGKLSAP